MVAKMLPSKFELRNVLGVNRLDGVAPLHIRNFEINTVYLIPHSRAEFENLQPVLRLYVPTYLWIIFF